MQALTATPRISIVTRVCFVCGGPSSEDKGLVYEAGGYVHATCSSREYELVTEVSSPDDEPEPPTSGPAASGPVLCEDCRLYAPTYEDYCEACQQACCDWDSDNAPDYDVLYERYRAAADVVYLLAVA